MSKIDVDQIMAEVLCQDISDVTYKKWADTWNTLDIEIRNRIIDSITRVCEGKNDHGNY